MEDAFALRNAYGRTPGQDRVRVGQTGPPPVWVARSGAAVRSELDSMR